MELCACKYQEVIQDDSKDLRSNYLALMVMMMTTPNINNTEVALLMTTNEVKNLLKLDQVIKYAQGG